MVRIVCIGSLVLAAVTAVSGHVIRWKHKAPPKYWETEILEVRPHLVPYFESPFRASFAALRRISRAVSELGLRQAP